MKRKILQGYVKNKTKEAALAAVFGALFVVFRLTRIPLAPEFGLNLGILIYPVTCLIFSYPYVWLFGILMGATAVLPFFADTIFGLHILYFLGKLMVSRLSLEKAGILMGGLATGIMCLCSTFILSTVLKIFPYEFVLLILPSFIFQSIAQGIIGAVTIPLIISLLRRWGVIDDAV